MNDQQQFYNISVPVDYPPMITFLRKTLAIFAQKNFLSCVSASDCDYFRVFNKEREIMVTVEGWVVKLSQTIPTDHGSMTTDEQVSLPVDATQDDITNLLIPKLDKLLCIDISDSI